MPTKPQAKMKGSFADKITFNLYLFSLFLALSFILLVIHFFRSPSLPYNKINSGSYLYDVSPPPDPCTGRYIYVYNLPEKFNADILHDCKNLYLWADTCPTLVNSGLGPRLDNSNGLFQDTSWYNTDQWVLSVIFHDRVNQYKCRTNDSSIASAIYVPYYAGLDIARYLWNDTSTRDSLSIQLVSWLRSRPEWLRNGGRDHFVVSGRSTWDFQRGSDNEWGNKFALLPEVKNMTILTIESSHWRDNEFAIPYPTYFHPSLESEVIAWQEKVRSMERPWLFTFVGSSISEKPGMVRSYLIDQCSQANSCKLQDCSSGENDCEKASYVMRTFMNSTFCLQPRGHTYTRRSIFDTILAGCIPVFFHPDSAYTQYKWYLPKNFNKFSVYIKEEAVIKGRLNVEDVLFGYSEEQIKEMREEVIKIIPKIIYNDPNYKSLNITDAFDIAIDEVVKTVTSKILE